MDAAYSDKLGSILLVDDDALGREVVKNIFAREFFFLEATNGWEGLRLIERHLDTISAIILDVNMPVMNGLDLLKVLAEQGIPQVVPVLLLTAFDNDDLVREAYELGVIDVLNKPVTPHVIRRRVFGVVELFRTRAKLKQLTADRQEPSIGHEAVAELSRGLMEALATVIEFRAEEGGEHARHIHDITKYMLTHTDWGKGLDEEEIEIISLAAMLHDVGKLAIPDEILFKPGKLSKEEMRTMKEHSARGAELLAGLPQLRRHKAYRYACDIARHHHERWDGGGYPDGLAGDDISPWAQIVSIVDVYDALVSHRVYKPAFDPDLALQMLRSGECGSFNPRLMADFFSIEGEVRKWYIEERKNRRTF